MIKVGRCKALARETLKGRYGTVVGAEILRFIVSLLFGGAAVSSLLAAITYGGTKSSHSMAVIITGSCLFTIFLFLFVIFTIYMSIGMYKLLLNICTGEKYSMANIFYGFRSGAHVGRVFWIGVLLFLIEYVFHFAFSALAALYYRMNGADSAAGIALCVAATLILEIILYWILTGFYVSGLIVLDDPSYRIGAALSESRRIMKGAKLKAFWLDKFSFIFWDILTFICFPAKLWVSPYKKATKVVLYLAAKGELDKLPIEQAAPAEPEPSVNADAAEVPADPEPVAPPAEPAAPVNADAAETPAGPEPTASAETEPAAVTEPEPIEEPEPAEIPEPVEEAEPEAPAPEPETLTEAAPEPAEAAEEAVAEPELKE